MQLCNSPAIKGKKEKIIGKESFINSVEFLILSCHSEHRLPPTDYRKYFVSFKKSCIFAPANGDGLWCNGNTTDSGSVIQGSSPCRPTS